MKYGCLFWRNTGNLGDDIQTYAQKRFLPQVDYLIDRETLSLFSSDKHEKVACIMNGWYLYDEALAWPPSDDVVPFLASVHFSPKLSFFAEDAPRDGRIEYFQQYGPVGCRDQSTLALMEKKGVPAYFSGCLTLTIQPFENVAPNGEIILVDVPKEIEEYFSQKGIPVEVCTHEDQKLYEQSFDFRMQRVEQQLKRYQGAKLVITTRLHCCMPCLALGTPVLLLYEGFESERYEGLRQYARVVTKQEILDGKWDQFVENPTANAQDFSPVAEKLRASVQAFVQEPEKYLKSCDWNRYSLYCRQVDLLHSQYREREKMWYEKLDQVEEAWGFVHKYERDAKVLFEKIDVLQQQVQQLNQERDAAVQKCAELQQQTQQRDQMQDAAMQQLHTVQQELDRIYASKSWRICTALQGIRRKLKI